MPSLGTDMDSGKLDEWLVKVGDEVHRGDVIAIIETPKSTVEVECFESGPVSELLVGEGETVPVGTVLARLGTPVARAPEARAPSPVLRHRAHQLGVDLSALPGTGPGGSVTRHDLEAVAAQPVVPSAKAAASPPAPRRERRAATVAGPRTAPDARVGTAPDAGVGTASTRARVSPLARRLAADAGLDPAHLRGSGPGGAVRADDVRRAAASARVSAPDAGPSPNGRAPTSIGHPTEPAPGAERDRAAEMRHSIAAIMSVSNREIPHYHLTLTVDLSQVLDAVRERNRDLDMGERLVPSAFLLAAAARAARAVPELNGHWVDDEFRPAGQVDLGLILSLRSGGLLVPVIAHADRLTVAETMAAMRELTRRARSGRLRGSDLTVPSITVSNLGDQGVDSVHGVIYPPQVALVGFGAVVERPWAVDGLLGVRRVVTVTLAGDHRATDGATGSRLLKAIDRLLQHPEEL